MIYNFGTYKINNSNKKGGSIHSKFITKKIKNGSFVYTINLLGTLHSTHIWTVFLLLTLINYAYFMFTEWKLT